MFIFKFIFLDDIDLNYRLKNSLLKLFEFFIVFVFQATITLQSSLKKLTNQSNSNCLLLENILVYCDDLKTIR